MNAKPLHKCWDFRLSIAIPVLGAAGLWYWIWQQAGSPGVCGREMCVAYAWALFKAPLALFSMTFPLAGLVAAYHRSREAHQQIQMTLENSYFSNFLKHQEEFNKHLDVIENKFSVTVENRITFYRKLFPKNSFHFFSSHVHDGRDSYDFWMSLLDELVRDCRELAQEDPQGDVEIELLSPRIKEYLRKVYKLAQLMGVTTGVGNAYRFEGKREYVVFRVTKSDLFGDVRFLIKFMNSLWDFCVLDTKYQSFECAEYTGNLVLAFEFVFMGGTIEKFRERVIQAAPGGVVQFMT